MLSLNQIIKAGNNFANAHGQVSFFGAGQIQDFATSGTTTYPVMWMDVEPSNQSDGVVNTIVRVYFMDRLLKGQGNLMEVLSDMQQVALDLVAHFKSPTYFPQSTSFLDSSSITYTPIYEAFQDDEIAGWYFDIVIKGEFLENRCQIPFDSTIPTPTNPNSMNFADNETPSGTINGSNVTFTTSGVPIAASLYVYYNGQLLRWGTDYTISGSTITMTFAPETGSSLIVHYRY